MSPSKVLPDVAWLILLAVGYFIAARIGIALTLEPEGLAAIWPASGIALAALLLCEPRRWPATLAVIFFVNILSNLTGGKALPVSLGFALANTLEPALGGWIMRRVCGPKITFGRISEVMALLGVAVLSNGVTALIGAAVPAVAFGAPYFHVFQVWCVEDGLGILFFTPAIILFTRDSRVMEAVATPHLIESVALSVTVIILLWLQYGANLTAKIPWIGQFLIFPVLIWTALRFDQRVMVIMILLIATFVMGNTIQDYGVFAHSDWSPATRIISAQVFLVFLVFIWLFFSANVKERRLAEARFLTILHTTREGFAIVNRNLRFEYVNDACCEMLGYSSEEFLKLSIFDLEMTGDSEEVERRRRKIKENGYGLFETRHKHKDGRPIDIEVSVTYKKGEELFYAFMRDISDRKQMEQERIRLQRLVAIGELSAGVSHNLNNILVGILIPAHLVKMKIQDPGILEDVEDIITSGQRAKDLVHRLHLSTRGIEEEDLRPVEVARIIEDAIAVTSPRWKDALQAHNVSIGVRKDLGITPPIKCNESRLHDIFVNLLLNAVDALPDGGTISIVTRAEGGHVKVVFSDTGIGMDKETSRRIFEPFFTTKMNVGTGLGLSTTYSAVKQWGGEIHVESQPGRGTTFTMLFPIWTEPLQDEEKKTIEMRDEQHGSILIVDDDEGVSKGLSRLLMKDYQVETFKSGQEALEKFAAGNYDVALIDMGMPGMAGDNVLQEIRRIDPAIVSILITGWVYPETDEKASRFDFRIQKPFGDINEVVDVVRKAVDLHGQRIKTEQT